MSKSRVPAPDAGNFLFTDPPDMEFLRNKLEVSQTADLLLHCVKTVPNEATILTHPDRGVDWQSLTDLAGLHRVTPLLYQRLRGAESDQVPADVLNHLKRNCLENAARNLLLNDFLVRLVSRFRAQCIQVLPFKGPALALMAYRDLALRQIGDLDILVAKRDYASAGELLESQGLVRTADLEWESSYVDESGQICIDLHRSVTSRMFPISFKFQQLFKRRATVKGPGGSLDTISPADMLIVLCVQVAKDGYLERCRLHKLCDIRELLRSQPNLSLPLVRRQAQRLGCRRILEVGLHLTDVLLGDSTQLGTGSSPIDRQSHEAAETIMTSMFGSEKNQALAPFRSRQYYVALRERRRDRVLPYLNRVFAPTQADRAFVSPPFASEFVYFLVRPIRLIRDYGRRLLRQVVR